uniref:Uncharacterized protein n=1 Tax=Arundo donax TaxID=35708 RepID=A0A0A9HLG4_ARUDO
MERHALLRPLLHRLAPAAAAAAAPRLRLRRLLRHCRAFSPALPRDTRPPSRPWHWI